MAQISATNDNPIARATFFVTVVGLVATFAAANFLPEKTPAQETQNQSNLTALPAVELIGKITRNKSFKDPAGNFPQFNDNPAYSIRGSLEYKPKTPIEDQFIQDYAARFNQNLVSVWDIPFEDFQYVAYDHDANIHDEKIKPSGHLLLAAIDAEKWIAIEAREENGTLIYDQVFLADAYHLSEFITVNIFEQYPLPEILKELSDKTTPKSQPLRDGPAPR